MDLADIDSGVVFDTVLFGYVFVASTSGAFFIWLNNRDKWRKIGTRKVLGQALAICWLDTGLVVGILLTSVGVMAIVSSQDAFTDLERLYQVMPIVLATFLWGGLLTGAGYSVVVS